MALLEAAMVIFEFLSLVGRLPSGGVEVVGKPKVGHRGRDVRAQHVCKEY